MQIEHEKQLTRTDTLITDPHHHPMHAWRRISHCKKSTLSLRSELKQTEHNW